MTFDELNISKPLLKAIEDIGFINPTPVQEKTFSVIMSGRDVVGVAQTGTGKTFAYLLPILKQLTYSEQRHPRVLILVPTRELVIQIIGELDKLTEYMTVRYAGIYGGTNINTQKKVVYAGLDILVAAPGRLYDLTMTGLLRLKNIQKVVIDEVDEMLNLGFRPQLMSIFEILPKKRQNLMFSATLTPEVETFINNFFTSPLKIEIASHGTPINKILQSVYRVPNYNTKINLLNLLLKDKAFEKVLVFVSGKRIADRVIESLLPEFKEESAAIHSNKSQNLRIKTLERFHKSELRLLVATDIAARGLDISDVSHVINFSIPETPGDYIHRIGRTGRADKPGKAISFITEKETDFLIQIEEMMQKSVPVKNLPENLKISSVLTESEKVNLYDKNYLKVRHLQETKGAFQNKKEKNKKINSGSPSKKRKRNKKKIKRSGKR
ncbi:MAG: DEAD/DEAH box helicase [Bacteroidales bacterium]|nr:DEAD/DEAH box helicase [Bacteroidales bacterium]